MKKILSILLPVICLTFILTSNKAFGDTFGIITWHVSNGIIVPASSTIPVGVNVTGSTQCLHVNSSGTISGTGSDCGAGGGGGGGSISTSTTAQIGKVAVWTGLSTLGNGILWDNGTVAGVGATSSTISFNIQGNAGAFSPFNIASSSGTSYLRVTQAGNVGIGTTTPTSLFQIVGGSVGTALTQEGNSLKYWDVPLATPAAPTLTYTGTASNKKYYYEVTPVGQFGFGLSSPEVSSTTGPSNLSVSNYFTITTPSVTGATSCDVFRDVDSNGAQTGNWKWVGNTSCGGSVNDQGTVGFISPSNTGSTANTYLDLSTGLQLKNNLTITNTLAVGTTTPGYNYNATSGNTIGTFYDYLTGNVQSVSDPTNLLIDTEVNPTGDNYVNQPWGFQSLMNVPTGNTAAIPALEGGAVALNDKGSGSLGSSDGMVIDNTLGANVQPPSFSSVNSVIFTAANLGMFNNANANFKNITALNISLDPATSTRADAIRIQVNSGGGNVGTLSGIAISSPSGDTVGNWNGIKLEDAHTVGTSTSYAIHTIGSLYNSLFEGGVTISGTSTLATSTVTNLTVSQAPTFSSISGSTQCLHVNSSGVVSGTGSDCGSGTLSGNGTNGQVAYYTGATTLSSTSNLLFNGTVLGLNATSSTVSVNLKSNAGVYEPLDVASSSGTSYFHITQGGNVGVGLTNPDSTFEVLGSAQQVAHIKSSNSSSYVFIESASKGVYFGVNSTNGFLQGPASGGLEVQTSGGAQGPLYALQASIGYGAGQAAPASGLIVSGQLGTNTTTPAAQLAVEGVSGTTTPLFIVASSSNAVLLQVSPSLNATSTVITGSGANIIFSIASSTGVSEFAIDNLGHKMTGGESPTCGTGCNSVAGDDQTFRAVTGTGVTAVTINFARAYKFTPVCVATDETGGTTVSDASSSPSSVTINLSASLTTKNIAVICQGSYNITN